MPCLLNDVMVRTRCFKRIPGRLFLTVGGMLFRGMLAGRRTLRHQAVALLLIVVPFNAGWAASDTAPALSRWVVLDSMLAEIVVALDGADQIVGVVGGTDHLPIPPEVTRLEGYRIVAAEPIMSLNPQLVLIGSDRVMPQTVRQLQEAGVQVYQLGAEPNVPSLLKRLHFVAELLGQSKKAEVIEREFLEEMAEVQQWLETSLPKRRARTVFVLAGGGRPTVAGGAGTYTGTLLTLSGAVNVAAGVEGYKVLSQEAMLMAAPDVILTNEDGIAGGRNQEPAVLSAPGLKLTPAAREQRIVSIPGRYLQGFGLNLPEATRRLARSIYPDLQ